MRILHVVGARPNFMKTAPILHAMARYPDEFDQILVHTGQHYDASMSDQFFEQLDLPEPDEYLGVGAGTHARQTAQIMQRFEPVILKYQPDWVFVVGDVNSTMAAALVCAKLSVACGHVEAGLRSFDRSMPEEINRLVTDRLADLLFTSCREADANLLGEGTRLEQIHFVGNVMIDSLLNLLPAARRQDVLARYGVQPQGYLLVTLHRPSNVDQPERLRAILDALENIPNERAVIFPVHPRTRKNLQKWGLESRRSQLILLEPLGYLDFLGLECEAAAVLTDSGGVQEETSFLGIPCLTVRPNTERLVTLTHGTNRLVAAQADAILAALDGTWLKGNPIPRQIEGWDGKAAERIESVMRDWSSDHPLPYRIEPQ